MDSLSQIQAILESTTFEEVHESTETFSAFLSLAQAALDQEDGEVLDEEEMDDAIAEGIEDFASTLYQIFGIDVEESRMDDGEEMGEYSQYNNSVASFSQGFGQALAGLIDQRFEDANDGISLVSEITGLDGYEISNLFNGNLAIEPETASELASAFLLDGNDHNDFVNLAASAFDELNSLASGYSEIGNGLTAEPVATMNADIGLRAEFEALKEQQAIGETLRALERQCDQMISTGQITTADRRFLIGDFETGQDRVASFSQACDQLAVPVGQQLDRIQYCLYWASNRPSMAMFGQIANDDIETDFSHEDVQSVQSFRSRNGYV